ncbi:MAG: sigma-54 interaction domain-containing protein [Flavobacteriales bacterium]
MSTINLQEIKNRFGIIGVSQALDRALEIAIQVSPTDLSVLITGESGVGKEVFSKIIHNNSPRKHHNFIAVNCGAIPEGTIDSELFGHEKGSFTGASEARKGYFEVVDGGTIFLDEVAELPHGTQVRLLRVLETGEFIRVGASKVQKTNVRVVAATNVNMPLAIEKGRFREDLFYRLNTVPIRIPSLRERREDINLLFRKFSGDFAEKYRIPVIKLTPEAARILENYRWPGNVRQLKNVAEQISILEKDRLISHEVLLKYLPDYSERHLPVLAGTSVQDENPADREFMMKALLEMRKELNELKLVVRNMVESKHISFDESEENPAFLPVQRDYYPQNANMPVNYSGANSIEEQEHVEETEETLSLTDREKELIEKALQKHRGKRKNAAAELGISERTLYRKIKEYDIKG